MDAQAVIWTEGKTDWQHLRRAFQALRIARSIVFHEYETDLGDDQLLKQCQALARVARPCPTIFIFDRDNDQIVAKVEDSAHGHKAWGNNVYSFAIPVPVHRPGELAVCIEQYYTDDELRTPDAAGRRLFLSTEFNPSSGRHKLDPNMSVGNKARLPSEKSALTRIIDCDVYNGDNDNVALPKADFARNVSDQVGQFAAFRFEPFLGILKIIDKILEDSTRGNDLPFGDAESFLRSLDGFETPHQLAALIDRALGICRLSTLVFIAATLRHYEQRIIDESTSDRKKVVPIKQALRDNFGSPSLLTLQKLARYCYHLIDERAPSVLTTMRAAMAQTPSLGPLGDMLDELERLLPSVKPQARILNKRDLKKPVLSTYYQSWQSTKAGSSRLHRLYRLVERFAGALIRGVGAPR